MNSCVLWGRLVTSGRLAIGLLIAFFSLLPAHAQDARQIVAESQKRSQSKSLQYEGTLEILGSANKVSVKHWEFARTGSFGASKSILRFTAPAEVKGVALLIVNHPDRASDQWMWTPGLGRDRHIALQNRATGFFGTGFSFEDLEERDADRYDVKLLADQGNAWKIESRPLKSSQYTYFYFWIEKDRYTFRKIEAYNKRGLVRVIEYKNYQQVKGLWTAQLTEVSDVIRKSRTTLKYDKLDYNLPSKDDEFTLEALRRE